MYTVALLKEIHLKAAPEIIIESVYLGGGSPLLISDKYIFSIMETLHDCFNIDSDAEMSIECNPEDLSAAKLQVIKEAGFNRLSIGVQSFQSDDLEYLKRSHSARQSLDSIGNALAFGITNINIDFIIGLPTQTLKSLTENYRYLSHFKIPHVSCYLLEHVPIKKVSEIQQQKLFDYSRKRLNELDYLHYEVSNFCFAGKECRQNLRYWKNQDYVGIGLSASGYEDGVDYKNVGILDSYIRMLNENEFPIGERKIIDPMIRKIVVGLRLLEGISLNSFMHRKKELVMLLDHHFLVKNRQRISVNPDKIFLLNEILSYFI